MHILKYRFLATGVDIWSTFIVKKSLSSIQFVLASYSKAQASFEGEGRQNNGALVLLGIRIHSR